ncbi:MAG: double zinc ribbon domain-containing protein [Thermoplasmata archaeon]
MPTEGQIRDIVYRDVPICPYCRSVAPDGALFCAHCGHTVVAPTGPTIAEPAGAVRPSPSDVLLAPSSPPPVPAQPAEWIPPALSGQAVHCPRCNTLISPVAVVCPVCQAPQPPPAADVGAGAPPR